MNFTAPSFASEQNETDTTAAHSQEAERRPAIGVSRRRRALCSRLIQGQAVTQAREFAGFWLQNSVHADEQSVARRSRKAVQALADQMIRAAQDQGFARDEMEAEIGDIYAYIKASIDSQNVDETARLRRDG